MMHPLLFYICSLPLAASALNLPLHPRADCSDADIAPVDDGPTADGAAGIGAEFESPTFTFASTRDCSKVHTNEAKGKIIAQRQGLNFMLTADTTSEQGVINAEYILDGRSIKVGTGDAARAGRAAADNFVTWDLWTSTPSGEVDVEDNQCNPWYIKGATEKDDLTKVGWQPQITAPMPLEALYSLMKQTHGPEASRSILVGETWNRDNMDLVTQKHFQHNRNGITEAEVTDDVLAFCSLVLSYAKGAGEWLPSPKKSLTFMPRTEFRTIFKEVKPKIKGDLYKLFESLACYKMEGVEVVVDENYCEDKGKNLPPKINGEFGKLEYGNRAAGVKIKSWIQDMPRDSASPDLLSVFDRSLDGSIGGLGTRMERMHNSERSVPLFEFRDLATIKTEDFESFMDRADSAVQTLHQNHATAPRGRNERRAEHAAAACLPTATSTTTKTATSTKEPKVTCNPFSDPDGNQPSGCQCEGMEGTYPFLTSSAGETSFDICGYTTRPGGTVTTKHGPFHTTLADGAVVSCATSTWENYAVNTRPTCAGATKVVSTVASIASSYSSAHAAASSSIACDPLAPAASQWADADAEGVWKAALHHYETHKVSTPNPEDTFLWNIAKFIGLPSGMDCADLAPDNNCHTGFTCTDLKSPAAVLIGNSLGAIGGSFNDYFGAYVASSGGLIESVNAITANFSEFPTTDRALEILNEVFQVVFPLIMFPVIDTLFSKIKKTIIDPKLTMLELIGVGNHFAQNYEAFASGLVEETILGENVAAMLNSSFHGLTKMDEYLFNGTGVSTLHSLITGGHLLEPEWKPTKLTTLMDGPILHGFLASLIPLAWQNSPSPVVPVVIDSGLKCGEKLSYALAEYMGSSVAETAGVCYQGHMWYGVGCKAPEDCFHQAECGAGSFTVLPGTSLLGSTNWPVTLDQILQASINTYTHNGQKNGGGFASAAHAAALSALYDQGITAPGVNTIPVCGLDELLKNLAGYYQTGGQSQWKNFPCNP